MSSDHFMGLFTAFSILLVGINRAAYPNTPEISVAFYTVFLLVAVLGDLILVHSGSRRSSSVEWLAFSSFSLTVLVSRAFINTAGIATPRSTGALGPIAVEQIWVGGLHLHHYIVGFMLLAAAGYIIARNNFSDKRAWILSGIGLGLVADEFGILVAGHTYHSSISYAVILIVQLGLFLLLVRHARQFSIRE